MASQARASAMSGIGVGDSACVVGTAKRTGWTSRSALRGYLARGAKRSGSPAGCLTGAAATCRGQADLASVVRLFITVIVAWAARVNALGAIAGKSGIGLRRAGCARSAAGLDVEVACASIVTEVMRGVAADDTRAFFARALAGEGIAAHAAASSTIGRVCSEVHTVVAAPAFGGTASVIEGGGVEAGARAPRRAVRRRARGRIFRRCRAERLPATCYRDHGEKPWPRVQRMPHVNFRLVASGRSTRPTNLHRQGVPGQRLRGSGAPGRRWKPVRLQSR